MSQSETKWSRRDIYFTKKIFFFQIPKSLCKVWRSRCWLVPNYRLVGHEKYRPGNPNHFCSRSGCKQYFNIFCHPKIVWSTNIFLIVTDIQAPWMERAVIGTAPSRRKSSWIFWCPVESQRNNNWPTSWHQSWSKSVWAIVRIFSQNYFGKIKSIDWTKDAYELVVLVNSKGSHLKMYQGKFMKIKMNFVQSKLMCFHFLYNSTVSLAVNQKNVWPERCKPKYSKLTQKWPKVLRHDFNLFS